MIPAFFVPTFTDKFHLFNEYFIVIYSVSDNLLSKKIKQIIMKQGIQFFAAIIFILATSTSCIFMEPSIKGNGKVVTEIRETGSFDEIEVSRGVNVYLTQGADRKVEIKADKNLLDAIEIKVEDDVLKIYSTKRIRKATSFKVFVTNPDFSKISSTSGSNVFSESMIKSENLVLSSTSGSNMKIDVETDKLTAKVSSGANIKLRGKTEMFQGKATSGANLMGEKFIANNSIVEASSGANLWITTTTDFEGRAGSGGNVFYFGDPKIINTKESSGGNVIKK